MTLVLTAGRGWKKVPPPRKSVSRSGGHFSLRDERIQNISSIWNTRKVVFVDKEINKDIRHNDTKLMWPSYTEYLFNSNC